MGASVRQVSARGTITLPKEVLAELGAGAGAWFEVSTDGERIVLTPKQLEDRLTDTEWAKLETLLEGPGHVYGTAAGAKRHVRSLEK